MRGTPEEWCDEATSTATNYLAPIYDLLPTQTDALVTNVKEISVNLACPNWFQLDITLDGEPFDLLRGTVLEYRRTLDLRQGVIPKSDIFR